jgi:phosphatidylinositol alpha-1,6-mannosyltransferase
MNRIVFLVNNYPPMLGGISHHLYDITRFLPESMTYVIGLPTPEYEDFDRQQKYRIERISVPWGYDVSVRQFKFLAPVYMYQLIRVPNVDITLCGQAHHTLMLPAWLLQKTRGTPFGVFVYGLDLLRPQTRRYRKLFNALLREADVVFADSQAAADITCNLGVDFGKIHVVNPNVDPEKLIVRVPPETIRERHGLEGKKCILTVGRLVERKGHDVVLQALPEVISLVPDVHYLIVGSGPNEARLRSLVVDLGLEQYVTFVGRIEDDELASYYSVCDVFVMISREIPEEGDIEGFGIVYLEANLMGKPVIAGRSGGVPDAVLHNKTGLLVDPRAIREVSSALIQILRNSELAHKMGEFGKSRVVKEFSSGSAANRVLAVLQEFNR